MRSILVVDDSPEVTAIVSNVFSSSGISVTCAGSVAAAWDAVIQFPYNLIILDISLPDGDGFELFARISTLDTYKDVPVLFLSAKEDISAKLSAFSLGADDYIVKPFNSLELKARVEGRLKKISAWRREKEDYTVGPFEFNTGAQRLNIRGKNIFIDLTPREFKIFYFLAKKPDIIFSREKILSKLSNISVHVSDRTIDTQICTLRKKLGDLAIYIESVPGEGYRFNPSAMTGEQITLVEGRKTNEKIGHLAP